MVWIVLVLIKTLYIFAMIAPSGDIFARHLSLFRRDTQSQPRTHKLFITRQIGCFFAQIKVVCLVTRHKFFYTSDFFPKGANCVLYPFLSRLNLMSLFQKPHKKWYVSRIHLNENWLFSWLFEHCHWMRVCVFKSALRLVLFSQTVFNFFLVNNMQLHPPTVDCWRLFHVSQYFNDNHQQQ